MSWNSFHTRGETLRVVMDTVNDRRDGLVPTEVPGVAEHFTDELDLVGALLLKWHARLSGNVERALGREPLDLESAGSSGLASTRDSAAVAVGRRVEDRARVGLAPAKRAPAPG